MRFKTIIFDLDGTIANTLPLCIAAFKKSIEPLLGDTLTDEEIVATFGPSEEGTIRRLIPEHETVGVKAYLKHYEELHHTCPAAFPGIAELLQMLAEKGVQLAKVTGKGIHSTHLSLQQFGLEKNFEVLETGKPEGPDKINGLRRVISRLNADLSKSLYVGDAPSDIVYCKDVGIPIAAAAWADTADAENLRLLNPDWLFYSVDDFREWLAERV